MDNKSRDTLLKFGVATNVGDNAAALRATRVALGTASFMEKLRYYIGLPPTKEEEELADKSRKVHEMMKKLEQQHRELQAQHGKD